MAALSLKTDEFLQISVEPPRGTHGTRFSSDCMHMNGQVNAFHITPQHELLFSTQALYDALPNFLITLFKLNEFLCRHKHYANRTTRSL